MNFQDIKNETEMAPLYYLTGDAFLCGVAKKELLNTFSIDEYSISYYNDENFDMLGIVNSANQFSFFDTKRAVVIDGLTIQISKQDQDLLLGYLNNPNINATIIILDSFGLTTFDFIKSKKIVDCVPTESYLVNHIQQKFNEFGKTVDVFLAKNVAGKCLNNILKINLEIKKICDFVGGNDVTQEVVDKLVSQETEVRVFDLTIALCNKDIKKAHRLMYNMLEDGEQPIKILGLIANHFRRVFFVKISPNKTSAELAKELGVKEYAITKAKQDATKFTAKQLKNIEQLVLDTDYNIKSGQMSQVNALYYLIFAIVNI